MSRIVGLARRVWRPMSRFLPVGIRLIITGHYNRRFGEAEIRHLHRFVSKGTVAVDVGASGGSYAFSLARLVGKTGQVICVEPIPEQAGLLERAARQLRLPVRVEACALSDRSGEATLHVPEDNGRSLKGWASLEPHGFDEFIAISVPVRTLDELVTGVTDPISIIKIDVEGHELAVLRGGSSTIAKHRPVMLVEIEDRHSTTSMAERFAFIVNLGYEAHFSTRREHGGISRISTLPSTRARRQRPTNRVTCTSITSCSFQPTAQPRPMLAFR